MKWHYREQVMTTVYWVKRSRETSFFSVGLEIGVLFGGSQATCLFATTTDLTKG